MLTISVPCPQPPRQRLKQSLVLSQAASIKTGPRSALNARPKRLAHLAPDANLAIRLAAQRIQHRISVVTHAELAASRNRDEARVGPHTFAHFTQRLRDGSLGGVSLRDLIVDAL